ncbi:4Fe-4S ferredoxin [Anaeromicrobium sediminis]|uniref:4Fe-4S ferredoxin n=1 Tax=Anaeromicrobium sediminis TaxID=1478221 RepID=A0A267MF93_9FIRM|nr:4Fe-4S ferredoxin [Anaeromicrobium sediminis]PAB58251.1 4Fe-4S ferredoxin [Anaeromicrobium sediminis]
MKHKSHQKWSWIIIVTFFILSIVNIWFGLFGFVCMGMPIYHALRGRGKIHCSKYCPRGSFLGKFLPYISLNKTLPKFMRTKKFKNFVLILMITMFSISLYHSQLVPIKVAKAVFRLMFASFVVGNIMGVIFKPRSWCQICPMGHGTSLIKEAKEKKTSSN